ncbi:hypothetical protein MTR_8g032750 [Medicago truncatula]|uniref:Uncharacterized protein n=1 Tax=Medicago truncatula TaxID=3880 RepID=A0A072TNJ6_MEDTR|nr:hypothetical protein MTR_8g032750 [Medicago truncatula]
MTVKLHGHAELSQYEILDLFVIQYISESRNIIIDLYKGDNTYALGSIKGDGSAVCNHDGDWIAGFLTMKLEEKNMCADFMVKEGSHARCYAHSNCPPPGMKSVIMGDKLGT